MMETSLNPFTRVYCNNTTSKAIKATINIKKKQQHNQRQQQSR